MNQLLIRLGLAIAMGMSALTVTTFADGFEAFGLRAIGRHLGVTFGPGYHAVPCCKHHAHHYNRSLQGIVHPAHRLTPLYHKNTPYSFMRFCRCNERAPYFMGNSMPPVTAPQRYPMVREIPQYEPSPTPLMDDVSYEQDDVDDDLDEEYGDDEFDDMDLDSDDDASTGMDAYEAERLPEFDDEMNESDDTGYDVDEDPNREAFRNPLEYHPVRQGYRSGRPR